VLRRLLAANAARRRRTSILESLDAIAPGAVSDRGLRSVEETRCLQDWIEVKVADVGTSRPRWSMDLIERGRVGRVGELGYR
jgi:hypothetical protein